MVLVVNGCCHSGRQVLPGEAKWILRKFKSMPFAVADAGDGAIAAYVRATRKLHDDNSDQKDASSVTQRPRRTEDGQTNNKQASNK